MMPLTITLFRGARGVWYADMTHADGAADVFRLFGTYVLPVPSSAATLPETLRASIQANNPGHTVTIMQAEGV